MTSPMNIKIGHVMCANEIHFSSLCVVFTCTCKNKSIALSLQTWCCPRLVCKPSQLLMLASWSEIHKKRSEVWWQGAFRMTFGDVMGILCSVSAGRIEINGRQIIWLIFQERIQGDHFFSSAKSKKPVDRPPVKPFLEIRSSKSEYRDAQYRVMEVMHPYIMIDTTTEVILHSLIRV